jgi:hypothetical protein
MCAVSAVLNHGINQWPLPERTPYEWHIQPPDDMIPLKYKVTKNPQSPTAEQWAEFLKLVKAAKEFDKATGQPDCEDPAKDQWMKDMESRITAIETHLSRQPTFDHGAKAPNAK